MYRIRRETGEEVSYGSVDEFGAAVAAGIVTAKAEIFHARAEKWLPIASHPHFKMAHDRLTGAAAPRPPVRAPGVTASGQRPAIGASGQRPSVGASAQRPVATPPQASATSTGPVASAAAPRPQAPQLRVVRPEATASPVAPAVDVSQKPAPRWNSAQRPAVRAVAPKPPTAPAASDLRLVRADPPLSSAATAPELPEVEFELLPPPEEIVASTAPTTRSVEPIAAEPVVAEAVAVEPAAVEPTPVEAVVPAPVATEPVPVAHPPEPAMETVVERSHDTVELVSHEDRPSRGGDVDIINPDRTMPVAAERELSALEIPAPIQDFTPVDSPAAPAARPGSRTPLFVGIGIAAAVAAAIGFFALKPSGNAPKATPVSTSSNKPPTLPASTPVAAQPAPAATGAPAVSAPKGVSTGLGGDIQTKKPKKQPDDGQAAPATDGLEPPPAVLPAAPSLGKIGDAAALPTVDAGVARNDAMDRMKALEKTRREIDSSMRQGTGR